MVAGAALGLLWRDGLNRLLGKETYGNLLNFLVVAQLGGLGDLGISGAVGIRMLQHLARGEEEAGPPFLANARGCSWACLCWCWRGSFFCRPGCPDGPAR